MRIYRLNFIITLLLSLCLFSCQKKEFTEPVKVNLEVVIAEGTSSFISFDKGYVMFEQIGFDGQRQQGGNVHFSTESERSIGPIEFSNSRTGAIKQFDIPQGIYTSMQWRFVLEEMEGFVEEDDDDDDDADGLEFDEPEEGGLILVGTFNRADGERLPLYIIIDDDEQLLVSSKNDSSYGHITLTSENTYAAQLFVDPFYAMHTISFESMEKAEISSNEHGDFIEISEDKNEALYEIIVYRLESSLKVLVE